MLIINIKEKKYSDKIVLENIEIRIDKFGIYGIVGKNGQGKTTLFKCITGLENYSGNTTLFNKKLSLQDVAWCPTEVKIYDELTANEFYDFYSHLLNIEFKQTDPLFDIPKNKLIKEFSTGMKKKAYLNAVLQKKYSVYIFDEPFNGLDLESNYLLMNYIKTIAKESIVLISSHILEILYKDCESIFLIQSKKTKKIEKQQFTELEKELFKK